jgi:hypothetical protein
MYKEFLAAEPRTDFQDQGLKGVTYICQLKENLKADYLLPRKNNAVVELSEWLKKSVNLLNTQKVTTVHVALLPPMLHYYLKVTTVHVALLLPPMLHYLCKMLVEGSNILRFPDLGVSIAL